MKDEEIRDLIARSIRSEMGDGSWDARDAEDLADALMAHAIPVIVAAVEARAQGRIEADWMECADCGLAAMDLPDGADPDLIFERGDDGVMRCEGCHLRRENRR